MNFKKVKNFNGRVKKMNFKTTKIILKDSDRILKTFFSILITKLKTKIPNNNIKNDPAIPLTKILPPP